MSDLRLYLLGTPRLLLDDRAVKVARRKALALAAYLALADHPQSRDVVASLLWPELDEEHARSALRSTLRALTTPVPFEWIQADRMTLALKSDAIWVDVNAFTGLLSGRAAHGHDTNTVCDQCVTALQQAIALYRSDFMAGFQLDESLEYEDWQLVQREWLRREFADSQHDLSNYYLEARRYEEAIKYARHWLAVDPLHEPAHRQLMRLYMANGQRTEALRQYKHCTDMLDRELATPPEAETTRLYEAIQSEQFVLGQLTDLETSPPAGVMPPLPSLVIGREQALLQLKRRVGVGLPQGRALTVIQGWPGVGKSTTVAMLAHDAEISRHFQDGVLWASLGEHPDILGELTAWADALNIGEASRARKIEGLSAQFTALLRDRRMLLIVDDVWQADHAAPFRVGGQRCALVMTSRLNDVAGALAPTAEDVYRLPVLTEESSLELLSKLSPETVASYPSDSRELVHDLEGLPLAVHVAGRLLQTEASMGWGVRDLLAELRSGAALLLAQPPSDMLGVERDTSPTVAALLRRSTDLLDVDTCRRFALLGLFVPKPATFDLDAMAITWNLTDPRPIARKLVNRGLLEPVNGGRFQMHALLVLHARSLLAEEGQAS